MILAYCLMATASQAMLEPAGVTESDAGLVLALPALARYRQLEEL
ncbi:hypothetical protein QI633_03640 [Nocardioides sp. QY071]|nr:hypothetical protein [Nocardioides sp. QY071]WGY02855.1 hypothetical protein QI633_03640 [Nocardioides sp. QY071]